MMKLYRAPVWWCKLANKHNNWLHFVLNVIGDYKSCFEYVGGTPGYLASLDLKYVQYLQKCKCCAAIWDHSVL